MRHYNIKDKHHLNNNLLHQYNRQIHNTILKLQTKVHQLHSLKWQTLSLDYWFLILILLNHYMLIEFMWYMHDNKWLGSELNAFKDPLLCLKTKITGLYSYIVSHFTDLYDMNITI